MGTSSKKAANTIREAAKKRLNSPVKFFNFQAWIEGRTPIKQKNKNKGPGLEEQVETEMSPNVERAVKNVGAMTREEQREFAAYMFGLTQPEKK